MTTLQKVVTERDEYQSTEATVVRCPQLAVGSKVAAEMLGVNQDTLAHWRCRGIGPVYVNLHNGKRGIRYAVSDLEDYVRSHRVDPATRMPIAYDPASAKNKSE